MKTFMAIILGFTFNSAWAYNPEAKLECRKSISNHQFLYFEVQPTALGGHPFELDLFDQGKLIYQKSAILDVDTSGTALHFSNDEITVSVNENQDYQSLLHINNDPQIKSSVTAECIYFVPVPDFSSPTNGRSK